MILGLGTDLFEVNRMEKMVAKGKEDLATIFTEKEVSYCNSKARKAEHYAARFAAKEAVLKALGSGLRNGISFTEVEIINDDQGKPGVVLHGRASEIFGERQVNHILISLSHTREYAIAVAILE